MKSRLFFIVYMFFLVCFFLVMPAGADDNLRSLPDTLKSASELDYPPFSIIREDGSADGFSVEILRASVQAIGKDVSFFVGPWDEIKQELIQGRLDVLPLVSYSDERDKDLDFSTPYLRMHGTIFVRKGEKSIRGQADLMDKEVLVMKGDTAHEYAVANNLSNKLILKDSFEQAVKDLSMGRHDALIIQQLVGWQLIKKLKISNLMDVSSFREISLKPIIRPLSGFEQKFCFAVPEGKKELLSLLNEGLALIIADGSFDELYEKWFGPIFISHVSPSVDFVMVVQYLLYILLPILFCLLIFGIWYFKKEISRQTQYLKDEMQEQKSTKKALQESEEKFKQMFERAPLSYQSLDENGNFLDVNATWLSVIGYEKHEVIGKNFGDFLHPDWKEHFKENFPRFKAAGEVLGVEFEIQKKDGTFILVTFHGKIAKDKDSNFQQIHCIFQNITDSRKAQKESEKNKIMLMKAEKLAGLGGWQWDIKNDIWSMSENWQDLHGCSNSFLSSKKILKIIYPPDILKVQKAFDSVVESGGGYEIEYRIIDQTTGKIKHIRSNGEASLDESGKVVKMFGSAQDITERKNLETKVIQAQKMESIGNLAGGIAHDFNNLLFPIIGNAELLMEDLPLDSSEYENAQEIFTAGKRGADLIKQILSFSRQEEHKRIPLKIQRILKEVLKLVRSSIPVNIEIIDTIQTDCGLMMADPIQLHQIVMNLVTNAYHAVEDTNGKIEVMLKEIKLEVDMYQDISLPSGRYAMLSVSDNGTGIARDVLDRVFEPYFTTKEKGRGTGLGLSVAFGLVKDHGGDITVYSEVGKGTNFKVYLPLMEKTSDVESVKTEDKLVPGNERILLVDDERSIVQIEAKILERLGYKVTSRLDSMEALKAFQAEPLSYDLVITDMTMPNMTGDQLVGKILAIRSNIPVIICTGFSEKMSKEQAKALGIKGYLMKPVGQYEMAKMARKVLDGVKKNN
ncbi:MAG: transporter substrate-binding domain-containing protein [Desulfobacteraceae bacterium]|nr:transporter substrate-binding domain-containing protein [Desulfobacteraceae bacterium]